MAPKTHVTVLLVEDNEMNRDMLARRLEKRGYSVVIAVDGQNGVNLARSEKPDLILLDVDMPGDGISVVPAIGAACPVTKIVMLTVSAADDGASAPALRVYVAMATDPLTAVAAANELRVTVSHDGTPLGEEPW